MLALGWHYWLKSANETFKPYVTLDRQTLGTCHGLSKVPYIRDTRRSIGKGNYVMKVSEISGDFTQTLTGTVHNDRVAIGNYNVDIHSLQGCTYPDYMTKMSYDLLPYFVPYRALTNRSIRNMLVTGKLMA